MTYISLFSGIGGLESASEPPSACCEMDEACRKVLARRFPAAHLHDDVTTFKPPSADVVVGGWPCQDLSVAGAGAGLRGERSSLFYELVRVARESGASSIVAENVPNLLRMDNGSVFEQILLALAESGFPHVAWRTLDARAFGLPHHRNRVFIVASKDRDLSLQIHRPLPSPSARTESTSFAAGFYTTAGLQSICYSEGFSPTLKVGSGLSIPSPPGFFFDGTVRKALPGECLALQGFDSDELALPGIRPADKYRMAGNAVAVPVGRFAVDSVVRPGNFNEPFLMGHSRVAPDGIYNGKTMFGVSHQRRPLDSRLGEFIDRRDRGPLSERAASGLVRRLHRSGKPCPPGLWDVLLELSGLALDPPSESHATGNAKRPSHPRPIVSTATLF